ncbi:MAG: transposase, partial [Candidatus Absconditabacterales bacterium]
MPDTSTIGIDVSKLSLDVCIKDSDGLHTSKIANTYREIIEFMKKYKKYVVFYEATGIYSNKLSKACNDLGITHYQLNPFVMCRIYESLGDRNKTDKIDAGKIAQAGNMLLDMYNNHESTMKLIFPSNNEISKSNHYVSVINSVRNQISRYKQVLEKLHEDIYTDKKVIKFYEKQLTIFQDEQDAMYEKLQNLFVERGYEEKLKNIGTIPSINIKFGVELLAFFVNLVSKGIQSGDRSKLKAFVGIDPNEKSSGTSLRKVHISRRGNKNMRCMFFMAGMKWYQLVNYEKYRDTDLGKFFLRMKEKFTVEG